MEIMIQVQTLSSNSIEDQKKKQIFTKIEGFLQPKSDEDQKQNKNNKKRSSPKIEGFCNPKSGGDQKKVFTIVWYYNRPGIWDLLVLTSGQCSI